MRRRTVLFVAVLALAVLAAAAVPWTLSTGGVAASIAKSLRDGYGIDLEVRGRSTLAFLPIPRVKFEDVRLASTNGALAVEGGTLRGELRLVPLLVGRVELSDLALDRAHISLAGGWPEWLRNATLPRSDAMLRRLVLTGSSLRWPEGGLDDINMVATWSGESRVDLAGSLSWQGDGMEVARASIDPASLLAGRPSSFALALNAPATRISLTGDVQAGTNPQLTGTGRIEIRSAGEFARWSGIALPLGSVLPTLTIEGPFTADRRRLTWPSVAVTLGSDRLEGTLGFRLADGRPGLTGTLAADRLDLSEIVAPILHAKTAGGWSGEPATLARVTSGDLDLRLSATEAHIGRLTFEDMATGILVRPGRVEVSVSRAGLNEGTLKGRLALTRAGDVLDLKAQGAVDRVELGRLLASVGQTRWIAGQATGQFHIEGSGVSPYDIVRQASGRTSLTVRYGELLGIGLNDVLKRIEKRPLAALMEWRGGRTPFDVAQLNLTIGGGIGEVSDGSLAAPAMRSSLQGQISFVDGAVALRATVEPTPNPSPSRSIVFDLTGWLGDVAVMPEAKALIERSGAAKPLFEERLSPAPQPPAAPVATAQ